MIHLGDITQLHGGSIPVVDVITGGSPCQDLSVAGKRAGLAGERSGLFMEQIRIVKEMREHDRATGRSAFNIRPRYMVWENVPGAFSSHKGEDFAAVLTEIARVAEPEAPDVQLSENRGGWSKSGLLYDDLGRWSIAWRVHDAQYWGVPQRRKRIALVADFGGLSAPEILFERKGMRWDTPQSGETGKGTAPGTQGSTTETGKCLNAWDVQSKHIQQPNGVAETLYSGESRRGGGEAYVFDGTISFQERAGKPGGGKGILIQEERTGALSTVNNQSVLQPEVFCIQGNCIDRADTAGCNGKGWNDENVSYTLNTIDRPAVLQTADPSQERKAQTEEGVMVLNDQGGSVMGVSEDVTGALRAEEHGHQPIVNAPIPINTMVGTRTNDETRTALGVGMPGDPGFTISAAHSHAVYTMNPRPQSMVCGENVAATLGAADYKQPQVVCDPNNPTPGVLSIENHPNDSRVKVREDGTVQSLTQRMGTGGGNVPLVQHPVQCLDMGFLTSHEEQAATMLARQYKDPPVVTYGMDRAAFNQGQNAKYDFAIEEERIGTQVARGPGAVCTSVVRRLTPLECERLQGFPDGWTDIGPWTDTKGKFHKESSDAARYKALGNSIALPFWFYLLRRIAAQYERPATLGSLFDGIGGFPLCWERCNGRGTAIWASEIEEFPIAVTKVRFPG